MVLANPESVFRKSLCTAIHGMCLYGLGQPYNCPCNCVWRVMHFCIHIYFASTCTTCLIKKSNLSVHVLFNKYWHIP